jgi:hypothetical protein
LLFLSSIILPCGNFAEDYAISAGTSMAKWQAKAKKLKFRVGDATVDTRLSLQPYR